MPNWLQDTFVDPDAAETALTDDRPTFISREHARQLTPRHIWRLIEPRLEVSQVTGFAELFRYLGQDQRANGLRQLVVDHFNTTLYLRDHLQPNLRHPGARAPSFSDGPYPTYSITPPPTTTAHLLESLLIKLNPVPEAAHNSYNSKDPYKDVPRESCFPGTRVKLLEEVQMWMNGIGSESIYVLSGVAGIGKSTVAQSVAEIAAEEKVLGASFFFSGDQDKRKTARWLFPTLAYYLSCRYPEFAMRVGEALRSNPDITQRNLREQFKYLIIEPLQASPERKEPTLLVVDAVDECEHNDAETFLSLLVEHVPRIPQVKVFITARPEKHIDGIFGQHHPHKQFRLHDIEDSIVQDDIQLYIKHLFSKEQVQRKLPRLRQNWEPTSDEKDMLVGMSGKLFIIAATAAKFILDPEQMDPVNRLALLLRGVSPGDFSGAEYNTVMDLTYTKIIRAAAQHCPNDDWIYRFHACVGTIVLLHYPLPCDSLAVLIELAADEIDRTLSSLHSLLAPSGKERRNFRIHHKSFPDFISDPRRCKEGPEFVIDRKVHHLRIAKRCLHIMHDCLHENICDLRQSEWSKDRVEIRDRIENIVSPHAAYACTHWASHLDAALSGGAEPDPELQQLLERFATKHLFVWLETLSLIGRVDMAYWSLDVAGKTMQQRYSTGWLNSTWLDSGARHVRRWLGLGDAAISTMVVAEEILNDGRKLVQRNRAILNSSPMHTYKSMLPFTPSGTALFRTYKGLHASNVDVIAGVEMTWNTAIAALTGHSSYMSSVVFSPDGSRLASASKDNTVRLWDSSTGDHIATLEGHSEGVIHTEFSPDASRFASGSSDGTVRLWNGRTGNHIATLDVMDADFKFSPEGTKLVSVSNNGLQLWDATTGNHTATLDADSDYLGFHFLPQGSRLVTSSRNGLSLWDWGTENHIASLKATVDDSVFSFKLSPEGSRLVSASKNGLILWDGRTGNHIATLQATLDPCSSDFELSATGSRIAWVSRNELWLWDGRTGDRIATLNATLDRCRVLQFSPDGSRLVVAIKNGLRMYNSRTGARLATSEGHSGSVWILLFSPDGSRLATASSDGTFCLWDDRMNNLVTTLQTGHVTKLKFSPDSSRVVLTSHEEIQLWDSKTVKHVTSLKPGSYDVIFSPDGSRLASMARSTVWLWDLRMEAHCPSFQNHHMMVKSFTFSPAGSQLALVSDDNTMQIWDSRMSSHVTLEGLFNDVSCIIFSPDGSRLASASFDEMLRDDKTGNRRITDPRAHSAYDTTATDGPRLTSPSDDVISRRSHVSDGMVHLWHARTGNHITALEGHSGRVLGVAFSPDGSRLATASSDTTVRLWNVDGNNGSHIVTLTGHSDEVSSVVFSPDGSRLASVGRSGSVQVWDGTTGDHIAAQAPDIPYREKHSLLAFSPDGSRLALGIEACMCMSVLLLDGETGGHVADLQRGKASGSIYRYRPKSLAFFQGCSRLAVASDNEEVMLWDITDTARPSVLCCKTAIDMFLLHSHNCLFLLEKRLELALWGLTVLNLARTNSFDTQVICWFSPDIAPSSLTVHPDGLIAAVHCRDGRLLVLDISKFRVL